MSELLEKKITDLNIDKEVKTILVNNKIETVHELCNYLRMELTKMGLNNNQINRIIVTLQLYGLDLKSNHAKTNSIFTYAIFFLIQNKNIYIN